MYQQIDPHDSFRFSGGFCDVAPLSGVGMPPLRQSSSFWSLLAWLDWSGNPLVFLDLLLELFDLGIYLKISALPSTMAHLAIIRQSSKIAA